MVALLGLRPLRWPMDVAAIDGHQPTAVRLVSRAPVFDDGGPPRSASGTHCDEGHRHDVAASVGGLRVAHSPPSMQCPITGYGLMTSLIRAAL